MDHDIFVVGGGCIGCSIAMHIADRSSLDVAVVEKEREFAAHQSGRNSGVLHPGFNYEPDTIKARFATTGTRRMKSYCEENDIPLRGFGVVVCAQSDEEHERLEALHAQATENGVETELLDGSALSEHEPHASGQSALHCPEAASVDSQQYVYQLARDCVSLGVDFYLETEVKSIEDNDGGYTLKTNKGKLTASYLVNAAGLHADTFAHQLDVGKNYHIVPFRGEYYELSPASRSLVNTMIYPTPDPDLPFLGVHFTRRADDKVIVGPNAVLAMGREAYDNTAVNSRDLAAMIGYRGVWRLLASRKMVRVAMDELGKSFSKARFTNAARKLVPEITAEDLHKSYAGIRAQVVSSDGRLVQKPLFVKTADSVHVLNAVSPGLTCSLPFGEHVADIVVAEF